MTGMRKVCEELAAKYESKEPPPDWPCYGDDVEFTDEVNGKHYRGTVLRFHPFSPVGGYSTAIWIVSVHTSMDDGKKSTPPPKDEWSVKYREITKIIRKDKV
ncbi:MAG: hypothetical protein RR742_24255 [Citrobacter sp.]|uniref:hypothetical protein n=1 Tax=Citrobacter sp. TaxID=1896336 RepID=UPI002FCC3B6A